MSPLYYLFLGFIGQRWVWDCENVGYKVDK